jgi:hypothetical protein
MYIRQEEAPKSARKKTFLPPRRSCDRAVSFHFLFRFVAWNEKISTNDEFVDVKEEVQTGYPLNSKQGYTQNSHRRRLMKIQAVFGKPTC